MRIVSSTILTSLVLILACSPSSKRPGELPGVILSSDQVKKTGLPGSTNPWTPTEGQIQELEARLPDYLMSLKDPTAHLIADSLITYHRQYLGLREGAKNLVYVNAFCQEHSSWPSNWKTEFVFVQDGGPCYFQVYYDPESKVFSRLAVNGDA
jgi:hypothetical protein